LAEPGYHLFPLGLLDKILHIHVHTYTLFAWKPKMETTNICETSATPQKYTRRKCPKAESVSEINKIWLHVSDKRCRAWLLLRRYIYLLNARLFVTKISVFFLLLRNKANMDIIQYIDTIQPRYNGRKIVEAPVIMLILWYPTNTSKNGSKCSL
jgi:hypothetical protein